MELKSFAPPELQHLLDLCTSIEETVVNVRSMGEDYIVTTTNIQRFVDFAFRILDEYIKLIKEVVHIEKEAVLIRNDAAKAYGVFLDREGKPKDVFKIFEDSMSKGTMSYFFPLYVTPIMNFVHSRIYDSLIETVNKSQKNFRTFFVQYTAAKGGIYPTIEEKAMIPPPAAAKSEGEEEAEEK